jgi:malate permease and related proteins
MLFQFVKVFINIVTPVFSLVFLGYFVGPRLNLDAKTLSRTAYYLLVPAFVFSIFSKVNIDISKAGQMVAYTITTHILAALAGLAIAKILRRSREMSAAFVMIASFGNVGNLGLSLIDFKLGASAQTAATVYFITILLVAFAICVGIANWAHGSGLSAVLSVFKTPALLAMIPVLFFYGTGFEVPLFLSRTTGLLGKAMIPMLLLTLGVQLSEVGSFRINLDVFIATSLRLIAAPLLAAGLFIFFSLSAIEIKSGILQSAMPVAVLVSIISIEYNIVPAFVTTTVLFSTIFSILTLTALLTLV